MIVCTATSCAYMLKLISTKYLVGQKNFLSLLLSVCKEFVLFTRWAIITFIDKQKKVILEENSKKKKKKNAQNSKPSTYQAKKLFLPTNVFNNSLNIENHFLNRTITAALYDDDTLARHQSKSAISGKLLL